MLSTTGYYSAANFLTTFLKTNQKRNVQNLIQFFSETTSSKNFKKHFYYTEAAKHFHKKFKNNQYNFSEEFLFNLLKKGLDDIKKKMYQILLPKTIQTFFFDECFQLLATNNKFFQFLKSMNCSPQLLYV